MKDKRYTILGINSENDTVAGFIEYDGRSNASYFETCVWALEYKKNLIRYPWKTNQELWNQLKRTCNYLNMNNFRNRTWNVYRINSKYCPVVIDFERTDRAIKGKSIKPDWYSIRNHRFSVKENFMGLAPDNELDERPTCVHQTERQTRRDS